jgi:hypothetical protein
MILSLFPFKAALHIMRPARPDVVYPEEKVVRLIYGERDIT